MPLEKYNKKRDFKKTPEPKGKVVKNSGPLSFVIQKHEATRLHYDFRLEIDGVLKSWAVPNGPSLNPEERRLAMMTEDHPMDYAEFEGIIPKGEYGGGTVMVWDQGVYTPYTADPSLRKDDGEKILKKQLKEGHITVIMLGEKVKGEFALIKLKNAEEENAWLLIKKGDEYVDLKKDILDQDKSVITGRSMEEIASQSEKKKDVWHSNKSQDSGQAGMTNVIQNDIQKLIEDNPKHALPEVIKPMLADAVDKPFDSDEFIYEMKWDGYRAIAEVEAGNVKLYSRNNIDYKEKFAPVYESLKKVTENIVLDGEVVMLDKEGKSQFQWIQDYPASKHEGELLYYVFDILSFNGHDLTKLPLLKRKEILKEVLPNIPYLAYSDHIEKEGKAFFAQAEKLKLEGIMAKRIDSTYKFGVRTKDWLKIKTSNTHDAFIAGFTKPRGGRKYFGALVMGEKVKGKLIYIGHTGGGFNEKKLKEIYELLEPLKQEESPFKDVPKTNEPVTWVKPKYKAEVSFGSWTKDRIMRHPLFVKMIDVIPAEAGISVDDKVSGSPIESGMTYRSVRPEKEEPDFLTIGKREIKITNPTKVFWPKEGYTKTDLITYYREMKNIILPYLKDRPQSMLRFPHGISEDSFFQKDVSSMNLEWVMRLELKSESLDKKIQYLLCQDEATLVYMLNLGCIDFNPWNSTVKKIDYPDYLIIDLDPEAVTFQDVVKVALKVREYLEKLDIESFVKTSGGRGMHILIPMGQKYTHEQVRIFAELLCSHIQVEMPELMSIRRSPKDRQKKVYLDYLQNGRGKTLASVYSVRPKPGAFVSTPLLWSEVNSKLDPSNFTMKNMLKRVEKKGDLFKGVLGKGVDMKRVLNKLSNA